MPPTSSDDESRDFRRKGEADAYAALALVISGILFWGGVGYLLSERFDSPVYVLLGLLLGMGGGLYLVWFRYGRQP